LNQVQVITIQSEPQVQISDQDAKQNGAAVGTGNAVLQNLTKTTFRSNSAFNYKGNKRFY